MEAARTHVYATNRDCRPALWLEQTIDGEFYICDDNVRLQVESRQEADEAAVAWKKVW